MNIRLNKRPALAALGTTVVMVALAFFGMNVVGASMPGTVSGLADSLDHVAHISANKTAVVVPEKSFNALAVIWPDTPSGAWSVRTRSASSGAWSPWQAITPMDDVQPQGVLTRMPSELLLVESADAYELRHPTLSSEELAGVRIHLISSGSMESRFSFNFLRRLVSAATASGLTSIVSRAEWGADESERTWDPEFATPQKFIVHHTAGSDGGDNPAATVRAIYYYHAVSLGWGDIGYNYLIDPAGTIYEGRYGGDGAIGAHTYDDIRDINFNQNTIGIALLGTFEDEAPTDAAIDALERLIGEKAAAFAISPTGSGPLDYFDEDLPNVIGHRDVDATLCPGAVLHSQLEAIRAAAADIAGDVELNNWSASLASQTIPSAMFVNNTATVDVTFTNTGQKLWEHDEIRLQVYDLGLNPSLFRQSSWPAANGNVKSPSDNIATGENMVFTIKLKAPATFGRYKHILRLINGNGDPIAGSTIEAITAVDFHFKGSLRERTVPTTALRAWRQPISLKVKNVGVATWNRNVVLSIRDLGGRPSLFRDRSWTSSAAKLPMDQTNVAPGQFATFTGYWTAPRVTGRFLNHFQLELANTGQVVQDTTFDVITRIDAGS